MRRLLAFAALTAAALVPAAPALAAKQATHAQKRALTHAVHVTRVADFDKVPRNRYRLTGAVVSTVSRSWAMATITPRKRFRDSFQGGYVVAVNPAGTRSWVVVDGGSAMVGCGIVPNAVLADLLGITRGHTACPPREGVS